jgi:hypothetical protein
MGITWKTSDVGVGVVLSTTPTPTSQRAALDSLRRALHRAGLEKEVFMRKF